MGFDINWLVPGRVLEVNASGTITEEVLEKLNDALYDSMGDQPLHMIYDASGVEKPFLDLERRAELLPALIDERMGWMIILNNLSPVMHFLTTSFASKIKLPIAGAASVEDGMAVLRHLDETLAMAVMDVVA
ncbi:MAG: hypothetical protein KC546_06690 [Anaerolineae bacterium]|nr:hypothetical protein [Anaerolineae bacterium]